MTAVKLPSQALEVHMDNPTTIFRFQERFALLVGGGMLLGLSMKKQSPPWEGVALFATGCLLLRGSVSLLRLQADRQKQVSGLDADLADL
jgi:hypothetical protein